MRNVLIDTDVILDFFFDREPFSNQAAQIFSLCEKGDITGYVTPVICSNTYYLLRRTANHRKVIDKLSQLLSLLGVLMMDKETILQALNSEFSDFEDALQYFAAIKKGDIETIITRNIKDYKNSQIGVLTPADYLISRELV